jgi:hypothetical protein
MRQAWTTERSMAMGGMSEENAFMHSKPDAEQDEST